MIDAQKELVNKAIAGDVLAFEELLEQEKPKMYNLAYRLTGNHYDAEDIVQNAYIRIYHSLPKFRQEAKFSTWVYQIVLNLYKDSLRKTSKQKEEFLSGISANEGENESYTREVEDFNLNPEHIYEKKQINEYLQKLINDLPEDYKVVLILRETMNYSYDEIADKLDISIGTVKSRLSRGRNKLKEEILKNREQNLLNMRL